MQRRIGPGLVAMCAFAGAFVAPANAADFPDPASEESAHRGAEYIAGQQGGDGDLPECNADPGEEHVCAPTTGESLIALVAGGGQPEAVEAALDFIEEHGERGASSGPYTGRVVSGLVAAGEDPSNFRGVDYMEKLAGYYIPGSGTYDATANLYGNALAMKAVIAGGNQLPREAEVRLRVSQCDDGGWYYSGTCPDGARDTDTTALVMSILAAVGGPSDEDVIAARQWLLETQNDSGCWGANPYGAGAQTKDSANSCGLALSAVLALGEDPNESPWAGDSRDAPATLQSLQQESGEFHSQQGTPGLVYYATVQAVPGLAGWWYPVVPHDDDGEPVVTPSTTSTTVTTSRESRRDNGEDAVRAAGGEAGTTTTGGSRPPRVDASPYSPTTSAVPKPTTTTTSGGDSDERSSGTPAIRRPPPGVAGATFSEDGDGVGVVPAGVAAGSLGSVALGVGWYWRRRALTAALTPWGDT